MLLSYELDEVLRLLAYAKSFGISWRKNEKKNSPAHDFRPNLTKSTYKSKHATKLLRKLFFWIR